MYPFLEIENYSQRGTVPQYLLSEGFLDFHKKMTSPHLYSQSNLQIVYVYTCHKELY